MEKKMVKIENRAFSCWFHNEKHGEYTKIKEKHIGRFFKVTVEEIVFWPVDILEDLLLAPPSLRVFRKPVCNGRFIWLHRIKNKRGSFIQVTKVQSSGGKGTLYLLWMMMSKVGNPSDLP
ncbi:hypothetical protein SDJN03_07042, partial [Cucurbita argyrosperma subsp. sororia]